MVDKNPGALKNYLKEKFSSGLNVSNTADINTRKKRQQQRFSDNSPLMPVFANTSSTGLIGSYINLSNYANVCYG